MADLVERLALIIDAHTDGAVSSVRKLSLEEKAAGDQAEVLKAKITDLEARMSSSRSGGTASQQVQLSRLRNEYEGLNATLAKMPASASRAESALSKVGLSGLVNRQTLAAGAKVLPGLAGGALAFGGFEFLKSGVEGYIELASEIRAVARASGATAPEASKLVAITHALGLDSNVAALGLFRLGKNIALTPDKFAQLNIAVAHTRDGNTDLIGTLSNVADAYQKTTDPARRAAIVYQAFGRAGTTLLPILSANRQQLEEIAKEAGRQGRIFTADDLEHARDYQIATRELQTAWQGLAITAGKSLVPALTDVAHIFTTLGDFTHSQAFNVFKWTNPFYQAFRGGKFVADKLGFGGGGSHTDPAAQAAQQIAAEQDKAAQDALSATIAGTFANAFDTLAGPQKLRDAKKTLSDARSSLTDAVNARAKAERDLAATRAGGPSAGAAQIEAANARVTAAEAALRTAQYLGGDQRIASARSSLASAQAALNRLRSTGASDTNRLADATDRLRRANARVADEQAKVRDAQRGVNDATGLNADELLRRITGQARSAARKARDNQRLANLGLVPDVIAEVDKLDAQLPGTLHKVAQSINHGLVVQLNKEFAARDVSMSIAESVSDPSLFAAAGRKDGIAYVHGFTNALGDGLPKFDTTKPRGHHKTHFVQGGIGDLLGVQAAPKSSASSQSPLGTLLSPHITVQGDIRVEGPNARAVAREIARGARRAAVASSPAGW